MAIISCGQRALPRDLDVAVSVSRTQSESATDLSTVVAVVQNPALRHGNERIRYYSSLDAVEDDFATSSEAWKMASAFFSQTPRARTIAIARAYTSARAAYMLSGTLGPLSNFTGVTDGSFTISIDGDEQDITLLNFSSATTYADVASVIETALQAVASGGYTAATVAVENENQLLFTSGTTGDSSRITILSSVGSGTDVSGSNYINADAASGAVPVDGYLPTGIAAELALINEAASCSGRFVYGWALEVAYRGTTDQDNASQWIQGRTAILGLVTNNTQAYDSAIATDIGSVLSLRGDIRSFVFYSDQTSEYPDVAMLSYMLHVNYQAANSTVTAKFKNLVGITTTGISESQLTVLQSKRYNVFTRIGNTARTVRDGLQSAPSWFIDDLINLDNFKEILQASVFNLLLREGKVPYTAAGYGLLDDAMRGPCETFVLNGTFAERQVSDSTVAAGFRVEPAFDIIITTQANLAPGSQAGRIGPPATINVNLAGAIHTIAINVIAQP